MTAELLVHRQRRELDHLCRDAIDARGRARAALTRALDNLLAHHLETEARVHPATLRTPSALRLRRLALELSDTAEGEEVTLHLVRLRDAFARYFGPESQAS